ncbi:MAG: MmgE/PrpD family protein [Bryobacteraceae bacterium]|jgi:2-methylcitrate dehydratase PrpD
MNTLIALAEFVQSRELGDLPPARFELLKLHLADTLGAADAVDARFNNLICVCAAIRSTEIDDIHLISCTTPGSVIMPTCRALGAPAVRDFFAAAAAGYELLIRLGRAVNGPAILRRRVWPTYFCAALGSAAAASRFYGLTVEKTAGALSTALTLSVGTSSPARSPEASRWLILGVAASNGVLAATAARNGLVGPNDLLEQHLGRIAGVRISRKVLLKDLGRRYLLDEVGMKPFPTARQGLAAIEACRELVAAEQIDVASIQEILVGVPESQRWVIDHPEHPADRVASIVSVQYQIALALLSPVRLIDVRRSPVFLNDQIRALMTKVTVRRAAHLEKHYPATWPAQVTIKVKGRRLQQTVLHPRGDANNPFGWNDLARKYKGFDLLNQVRSLRTEDPMPKLWEASH